MKLTEKDIQVLDRLKKGMCQKQIADELHVEPESITKRLARMREKNNCETTIQLITLYMSGKTDILQHASSCTLVHANTSA